MEKQTYFMVNYVVLTGCNPEIFFSKDTQSPNHNHIQVDIIRTLVLEITIVHISRTDCKIIFTETVLKLIHFEWEIKHVFSAIPSQMPVSRS